MCYNIQVSVALFVIFRRDFVGKKKKAKFGLEGT